MRQLDFIFFIKDKPTGLCYYRDNAGNVKSLSIMGAGLNVDVSMKNAPDGWMNQKLAFLRAGASRGYGMNRSYSDPQKFVRDAAYIVRTLIYRGRGIEVPLSMIVFKYNGNPEAGDPTYEPYYEGLIDLPNQTDIAAEGFQANMMEGGVMQWLKAIENTLIEIPCDGSIPENIKINMDGMLFGDVLNYSIVPMQINRGNFTNTLSMAFIGNEGDNAGIVHNDPQFENLETSPYAGAFWQSSPNWTMNSQEAITVEVSGEITVESDNTSGGISFAVWIATSKTLTFAPAVGLINNSPTGISQTRVTSQRVYNFSGSISIDALENLYIAVTNIAGTSPGNLKIIGGRCSFSFASKFLPTSPWAMTLYDLGKLIVKYGTAFLSTTEAPVNLSFESKLLKNNLNLVATPGDALRASGDPNYQKFYNAPQLNPNFPNIVLQSSYGPVLKTTLADYFASVNAILCASMSSQIIKGENETLFIESRGYVFDASVVNMDNGEVSEFKTQPAIDLYFTLLRIGYSPQTYDQKAGKYAWNTTAEWQAPFKSIPSKVMEVISKYLTDPYLIERLRADISDTSTTRNSSDNSVFIIDTDPDSSGFDSYSASFTSLVPNIALSGNTNILLQLLYNFDTIPLSKIIGNYLAFSNSNSIFLFNQASLSAVSKPLSLSLTGNLLGNPANLVTGLPADTAVIKLFINGAVVQTWTTTATGASTPISISYTLTRNWSYKDSIYLTCDTSVTGTVVNLSGSLQIGAGGVYLTAPMSNATIDPGSPSQLLAFDTPTAQLDANSQPVISWGFQFFYFNSVILNSNFDITVNAQGILNAGTAGNTGEIDVWLNGQSIDSQVFTKLPLVDTPFTFSPFTFNRTLQLGDIIFITGSSQFVHVFITQASIKAVSTQIKALNIFREQYDAIYGIPTLLGNLPGTSIPITTGAGAPYNIRLSPKRMLMNWSAWWASIFFDQIPGVLQFCSLSKNQYLTTTKNGVTITENADVEISDFGPRMFTPRYAMSKTRVQETFSKIFTGAANGYVNQTYMGLPFPIFPFKMEQKPALNEAQEWKGLLGPTVDVTTLIDLNDSGLNFLNMAPNSIWAGFLNGIQFVPSGAVLNPKYHTKNRNQFWFSEQIRNWINQNNYWQPWQIADILPMQFFTRDLNAVTVKVYACGNSTTPVLTVTATQILSPAVIPPYFCWKVLLDMSSLPAGGYYITAVGGTGGAAATLISEGINLQTDWTETCLAEYKSSVNKQSMIFDDGQVYAMRFFGFYDNRFKQKYKGAFYVDQPQNIVVLNAIPYETTMLWCGGTEGQPDYVTKKLNRILILDGCMLDGEGFSMNESAEWSEVFIAGAPKKFQEIEIRPTTNLDGIGATASGVDQDASIIASVSAGAFGPNAGAVGSPDPTITDIIIT